MAKALELSSDALAVVPSVPQASQVKKTAEDDSKRGRTVSRIERDPLQVRWPAEDVKAAKLAAIQMDFPTVSEFMLACFHAYRKQNKI